MTLQDKYPEWWAAYEQHHTMPDTDAERLAKMYPPEDLARIVQDGRCNTTDQPNTRELITAFGAKDVNNWLSRFVANIAAFIGMGERMSNNTATQIAEAMTSACNLRVREWPQFFYNLRAGELGDLFNCNGVTMMRACKRFASNLREQPEPVKADEPRTGLVGIAALRQYMEQARSEGHEPSDYLRYIAGEIEHCPQILKAV